MCQILSREKKVASRNIKKLHVPLNSILGTNYTVKTFTGKTLGAGTDAKIYFELIGERGSSDFRQLDPTPAKYEPGR